MDNEQCVLRSRGSEAKLRSAECVLRSRLRAPRQVNRESSAERRAGRVGRATSDGFPTAFLFPHKENSPAPRSPAQPPVCISSPQHNPHSMRLFACSHAFACCAILLRPNRVQNRRGTAPSRCSALLALRSRLRLGQRAQPLRLLLRPLGAVLHLHGARARTAQHVMGTGQSPVLVAACHMGLTCKSRNGY
jgi:hypothetical protein